MKLHFWPTNLPDWVLSVDDLISCKPGESGCAVPGTDAGGGATATFSISADYSL
jgi:hypothetical protein